MKKEMLINVSQPEEVRIAVIEDGQLEELYLERASAEHLVGNIYKGVIVNIEPSIQAAFVDFGMGKNGFLHVSDVEPQFFRLAGFSEEDVAEAARFDRAGGSRSDASEEDEDGPPAPKLKPRPPIQDIFRRGDEVLIQVIKEGIGTKGPTLSTYISIPGRYLVLMPALGRVGVSRKIEDEDERRLLRQMMRELQPPPGLGFIVRTAGAERTKKDLHRDMAYLLRLWRAIVKRVKDEPGPATIYEESDLIIRTIRDVLTTDVDRILIDQPEAYQRAKEFIELVMPKVAENVHPYDGKEPLFHKYNVEEEIHRIHQRTVALKKGGSIVIDQTEALVAIDVNSGNFRGEGTSEDAAYELNVIAAKEIARQLRLRDLGGVIVNDFIDMRRERHRRGVEKTLREALSRDRARTKVLRISPFGLIEMTRQRVRPSLKKHVYADCPCCKGRGVVKTAESISIEVIRLLWLATQKPNVVRVTVRVHDEVAHYLNNKKRREIMSMEEDGRFNIQILGSESLYPEHLEIDCRDSRGQTVPVDLGVSSPRG